MKVLKIDMKRFYAGFKAGEILGPYLIEKEKYINNEYLEQSNSKYSEYHGITDLQRLYFLLSGLEIKSKIESSRSNIYIHNYLSSLFKSFKFDLERLKNGEKIDDEILIYLYFLYYNEEKEFFDKEPLVNKLLSEIDIDFIMFLITVINSLYIDNVEPNMDCTGEKKDVFPPFVGIMDKISSNKYKKEKLSLRQKYVIIAQLIYLCFKKNKINNKDLLESGLHYIIWGLIDRTDAECDYLQKTGKEGGYAAFLNSTSFRSPMSAKAVQDMFCNIEYIYQKKDILDRMAAREVQKQIFDEPSRQTKRKEWKKQEFIDMLKKYKNQSEMAKSYGISRQRISELKKKFKIKEL